MIQRRLNGNQDASIDELTEEHATLDARLLELEAQRSLSPEEQYEKAIIKKRKLAIKDRIQQLS